MPKNRLTNFALYYTYKSIGKGHKDPNKIFMDEQTRQIVKRRNRLLSDHLCPQSGFLLLAI